MSVGNLPTRFLGQGRWPWALAALLCVLIVAIAWPGTLIGSSFSQLAEIQAGQLTDRNAPLTTVIWRALGATPQSMLIVNATIYWAGIALLADQMRRERGDRWALAILAVGLSPLSVYYLGHVQKDVTMVAMFLFAGGLVARVGRAYAIAPALLGMLARTNGVFAAPPFLLPGKRLWRTVTLSLAIALALIPLSSAVNRSILGATPSHAEKSLQLYDIAGTGSGPFTRCYQPFEWDTLVWDCDAFDKTPDDLTKPWLSAIASHPLAYARHRISFFNHAIFFLVPPRQECVFIPRLEQSCAVPQAYPLLKDAISRNALVWPVTWLVVGLLLLMLPLNPVARMFALSAMLYGLAYLVIGVATGLWYFYWTELGVQLALVWQLAFGLPRWRLIVGAVLATWVAGYAWRYLPLLF